MPVLRWAVLCERAILEQPPRSVLSMVDVLEQVRIPRPPADIDPKKTPFVALKFNLVSYWSRAKGETPTAFPVRIRVLSPKGKEVGKSSEVTIDLESHANFRAIMGLAGFPFLGPGTYVVALDMRKGKSWKNADKQQFEVVIFEESTVTDKKPAPIH